MQHSHVKSNGKCVTKIRYFITQRILYHQNFLTNKRPVYHFKSAQTYPFSRNAKSSASCACYGIIGVPKLNGKHGHHSDYSGTLMETR